MNNQNNRRLLVVEVNWVGDVLFSTAAIRTLRKRYPESFIACLVHKRCSEVLTGNPNINELIILDEEKEHSGLLGKLRLIGILKSKKFDTAYFFHRSFTRTVICFLSGIKNRIGYFTPKRKLFLTESLMPPEGEIHRAAHYLYIVTRTIESDKEVLKSDFFIDENDNEYVDRVLRQENIQLNKKILVMHPAGNWTLKRWPKENFAQLADELIEKFDVVVVFSGSKKEQTLISDIIKIMRNKPIDLSGKTSLKQLGALFSKVDVVISADSGPLHIAVALNRPTIAIFGPTSINITGPLTERNIAVIKKDVDCDIPCYKLECIDNHCMSQITAEDVLNCIKRQEWLIKKR